MPARLSWCEHGRRLLAMQLNLGSMGCKSNLALCRLGVCCWCEQAADIMRCQAR